jgi:hydroxylamine reductase
MKNVRRGPTLPAFISPNVLHILVKNYNIMPISEAEKDMKAVLKG